MPVWQKEFERLQKAGITVVGIALDAEGVGPARKYYEQFGVTFPALVDPNYATGFGVVPLTFYVNEHGVVQSTQNWKERILSDPSPGPVTDAVRSQWTSARSRLDADAIRRLTARLKDAPDNLPLAVDLASRYLDLQDFVKAREVLIPVVDDFDAFEIAQSEDRQMSRLLGQAFFQLSRASAGKPADHVRFATMSYYLNPSIGFGKQIARIVAPEKFDDRPDGSFDNRFREGTLRRLKQERAVWLKTGELPAAFDD